MQKLVWLLALTSSLGCGDSGDGGGGSDSTGVTAGAHGTSTGSGSGSLPTASVRIVNLVPGETFDVFGPTADYKFVQLKTGIASGSISDYIEAPIPMESGAPTLVVMPAGQMPDTSAGWLLHIESGPQTDRTVLSEVGVKSGQRVTLVVDHDSDGNIQSEALLESTLPANDPTRATLHVASRIDGLTPGLVRAFGVVGQACLITQSLATPDPWHVAPGDFDFGLYDLQNTSDCTTPIAQTHLSVAAGADRLVVVYPSNGQATFIDAPIQP